MKGVSNGQTWRHIPEERNLHGHSYGVLNLSMSTLNLIILQNLKFSNKRHFILISNRKVHVLINHKYLLIQSNNVMVLGVTPRETERQVICL
jgi:hypothetical protein